ncbi:Uncharacterized MFS-type transporter yfiS [Sulfobacillus acidophilus TPY]|nr:Uncharacterized MFS-type transporter yfiS [Sulfobacillus acidophilus TPY]
MGDALYAIVMPLFVYHLTHHLTAMSVMTALAMSPLLFGPGTGVLVDRWGANRLVAPALGIQVIAGSLIAILGMTHRLPIGLLYVLGGILEVAGGVYRGAWMAALPRLFPGRGPEARAALGILYVITTLIGPFLSGLLLPRLGYIALLWINVASYILPIVVSITGVPYPVTLPETTRISVVHQLLEGWAALRSLPVLFRAILIEAAQNLVISSGLTTVLIYYLRHTFHLAPGWVSWIVMADGVGALIASIVVPRWGPKGIRWIPVVGSGLAAGASFLLMVSVWWIVPVVLVLLPLGVTGISTAIEMAVYHQIAPDVLGRVNGISRLIRGLPAFACPLLLAALTHVLTVQGTFLVIAVMMTMLAAATLHLTRKTKITKVDPLSRQIFAE